jgi:hypothetical protein
VSKLRASFSEGDEIHTDEENAFETFDVISNGSEVTESVSAVETVEYKKNISNKTMHKRLRSDSNIHLVRELLERDAPRAIHKRAPTCPAAIFDLLEGKRISLGTFETKSLTDSECTNDPISCLVGKDIILAGNLKNKTEFIAMIFLFLLTWMDPPISMRRFVR